jgi:hypothetical protein
MECTGSLSGVFNYCYKLTDMMELVKFEKGSFFSDSKAKSLTQRWLSALKYCRTCQNCQHITSILLSHALSHET